MSFVGGGGIAATTSPPFTQGGCQAIRLGDTRLTIESGMTNTLTTRLRRNLHL